jgi:hypothetical protein
MRAGGEQLFWLASDMTYRGQFKGRFVYQCPRPTVSGIGYARTAR